MKKNVFNLIIVDESGSMSTIRKQAFAGMNETLNTVRQMQEKFTDTDQKVTLITFDSTHMKWHYDNTPAKDTRALRWNDYSPCAGTPLYDAMGAAISKVNAQAGSDDNVLVTVITDGWENASCEWTLPMIRQLIEKLKHQHWTFTLIGTDNLDVEQMAAGMCIDEHLEFHEDAADTERMFARERRSRVRYNECVVADACMPKGSFFEEREG